MNIKDHSRFMASALGEAEKALACNEVPIGCIIVDEAGEVIARAFNQVEEKKCQTAHAEVQAIEQACKKQGDWRLEGCWVYVTLEPCAMCMNLLLLSRVSGVVYGADSPVFGYSLDNSACLQLYRKGTIAIVKGVLEIEAANLLRHFFKQKRKKGSDEKESGRSKKDAP